MFLVIVHLDMIAPVKTSPEAQAPPVVENMFLVSVMIDISGKKALVWRVVL